MPESITPVPAHDKPRPRPWPRSAPRPWKAWAISLLGTAVLAGFAGWGGAIIRIDMWLRIPLIMLLSSVFTTACMRWLHVRQVKAMARRLIECRGRICTRCGYDLRGSATDGVCPECGQAYTMAEMHEAWRDWLAGNAPGEVLPVESFSPSPP
jgi:hypothetical protein